MTREGIFGLLTKRLVDRFGEEKIIEISERLPNYPKKFKQMLIIYLGKRDPRNADELNNCVEELINTSLGKNEITDKIKKIKLPLTHFFALGRTRVLEHEENLLAHLWDCLGGGKTEVYLRTIKELLENELMIQIKTPAGRKFRLNTNLHFRLEQLLINRIGEKQLERIDYFLSVYYRNAFNSSRKNTLNLQYLENYIYHSLVLNYFDSAYKYVFESDILDVIHKKGLLLDLEAIMKLFEEKWEEIKEKKLCLDRAIQGTRIYVELGRIYKDLDRHNACAEYMEKARKILEEKWEGSKNKEGGLGADRAKHRNNKVVEKILRKNALTSRKEDIRRSLQREVWHYLAISYSQLGNTISCLNNYHKVVIDAIEHNIFTWFDALSLGYIAYDLKFHNIKKARELGEKTLQMTERIGDLNTIIKNMCNLGSIYFFAGDITEAERVFTRAIKLFKKDTQALIDKRTMGRTFVNSAVVLIAKEQFEFANIRLEEGEQICREVGDRRRFAIAISYRGIIRYKEGKIEEGKKLVLDALNEHLEINTFREILNETMTYLWMNNLDNNIDSNSLLKLDNNNISPIIRSSIESISRNENFGFFLKFWKEKIKPLLLESSM